jgi:serine/alanine adding enzyme
MMQDIFFSTRYGKLNELVEDGIFEVFIFKCEFGEIMHGFIKRKINILLEDTTPYYDIVTPYGYGGPVVVYASNKERLIEAYFRKFSEYCSEERIVSEFIRFHLFDNKDIRELYYGETSMMSINIIRDFKNTLEEIWMEFEPKVRKNVKRAISKNLKITIDPTGAFLPDFLEIYYSTMDRKNAANYYYFPEQYFKDLNANLKGNYIYFHVTLDDKFISSELILYSEKYAYSFLGGTNAEFYDYMPNDFLKYEIIKWCKTNEKELFILGGGTSNDDGITRYKRSFAPFRSAEFFVGKKIHNNEVYNMLTEKKCQNPEFDTNTTYFPKYRG